jgi:predicted CxxxxCH...CXXCH cytochrome family protein
MRTLHLLAAVLGICVAGCIGSIRDAGDAPPPNADPQAGCALDCHGTSTSNAPPQSLAGATDTSAIAVGAHQAHLGAAPTWHRAVACADCHVVPAEVGSPGHLDGDGKAEVRFGMVAGPGSTWTGTTCTTGCHGSAAMGGVQATPEWTRVDGTQATCGSCHGVPPPPSHPADTRCAQCHPSLEEGSRTFRDPALHINGAVDVVGGAATGGCTSCHGSPSSAAPPRDLSGDTAPTARGVGAHAAHLGASTWRRQMPCTSCHVVPATADAPGHRDGDGVAELRFDGLNPAGTYAVATGTCASLYCHGTGRGNTGAAVWTAPGPIGCGACHSMTGSGMSGDHSKHLGEGVRCSQCHGTVVDAARAIINPGLHVNGVHEVKLATGTFNPATRQCTSTACHGTETW